MRSLSVNVGSGDVDVVRDMGRGDEFVVEVGMCYRL